MIDLNDRVTVMVKLYGEVCTRKEAAKILGCVPSTISTMLKDGRLDSACEGSKVDVRSIARYIAAPEKEDYEARKRAKMRKYGSKYAV